MTDDALGAYLAAWSAGDSGALGDLLAEDGTYEDPTTVGPISAAALPGMLAPLAAAVPDRVYSAAAVTRGAGRTVVEWMMTATMLGPLHGAPATGRRVALAGVDVLVHGAGGLRVVRRHYDARGLAEQAGLTVLVQPADQERAHFGYSMRVHSGNPRPPGILALTWIAGADEAEKQRIRTHARQNVQDFLAEPGFIAIVTGFAGLRGFTTTAWEDEAAMRRALAGHHAVAMAELRRERFVASVWTSVWQPCGSGGCGCAAPPAGASGRRRRPPDVPDVHGTAAAASGLLVSRWPSSRVRRVTHLCGRPGLGSVRVPNFFTPGDHFGRADATNADDTRHVAIFSSTLVRGSHDPGGGAACRCPAAAAGVSGSARPRSRCGGRRPGQPHRAGPGPARLSRRKLGRYVRHPHRATDGVASTRAAGPEGPTDLTDR